MSFLGFQRADFPFSGQSTWYIQAPFPGIGFTDTSTVPSSYDEIRNLGGNLYQVINATWDPVALTWRQVDVTKSSQATVFNASGGITLLTAAAVGGIVLNPPITFVTGGTLTFPSLTVNGNLTVTGSIVGGYSFLRNKIINGGMSIDQRNNGASITPTNGQYSVDRWIASLTQAAKFSLQQIAEPPALGPTSNFQLIATSLSSYSPISTDNFTLQQRIEANNIHEIAFGTAAALPMVLSFWVVTSVPGTYSGCLQNNGATRIYPFIFTTTSTARTRVTVPVVADSGGSWTLTGNGVGMSLVFNLGTGSANQGPTPLAWNAGIYQFITGTANLVATAGATLAITDVQLETGPLSTPFEQRLFGQELSLCQRYCYVNNSAILGATTTAFAMGFCSTTTSANFVINLPTQMRTFPTLATTGTFRVGVLATTATSGTPTITQLGLVSLQLTTSTGTVVAGQGCSLQANTDATTSLIFSAEL